MDRKQIEVQEDQSKTEGFNLTSMQVAMIEEAIGAVGAFGEVTLVVEKARLRYITAKKSFNAQNYMPGTILAKFEPGKE